MVTPCLLRTTCSGRIAPGTFSYFQPRHTHSRDRHPLKVKGLPYREAFYAVRRGNYRETRGDATALDLLPKSIDITSCRLG